MGNILSSKTRDDGKVIFEVAVDYDEALQIKGHLDKIHIFTENIADIKTNMAQRGKNESTMYFLIPKELRKNLKLEDTALCQKFENDSKVFFIFTLDKVGLEKWKRQKQASKDLTV